MALAPSAIHDLAEQVLACVCVALDEAATKVQGYPGCPTCRVCVVPGQPAWDECFDACTGDAGGQLTVNVARVYPSTQFPAEDRSVLGTKQCALPQLTAVELVVTLLRCAPMPDSAGCPPTCVDLQDAARIVHVDAATVYNALICCLPHTGGRRGRRFVLGQQRTIGPQGGCVGVEQRIIAALPGCAPCSSES